MNNNELPVVHKLYELYKLFFGYLTLFPKKDRHTVGAKCEDYIITIIELALEAGGTPKNEKQILVRQANVKLDTLKIFIRLCKDLNLLDDKKYIAVQEKIQEIGKMLGGWQRSLNN